METTGNDGNPNVSAAKRNAIQLGTEEELSARQEQTMKSDSVLGSLSPLINSMRVFGLYFTRVSPTVTSKLDCKCVRWCQMWNAARIYSTVMLVVTWLFTAKYLFIDFDIKELLGADLFMKLSVYETWHNFVCFADRHFTFGILHCQSHRKSGSSLSTSSYS